MDRASQEASALAAMISARVKAEPGFPLVLERSEEEAILERRARAQALQRKRRTTEDIAQKTVKTWSLDEEEDELLSEEYASGDRGGTVESIDLAAGDFRRRKQLRLARVDDDVVNRFDEDDPLDGFIAEMGDDDDDDDEPVDEAPQKPKQTITLEEIMRQSADDVPAAAAAAARLEGEKKTELDDDDDDKFGGDHREDSDSASDDSSVGGSSSSAAAVVEAAAKRAVAAKKRKKLRLGRVFRDEGDVVDDAARKRAEKSALEVFADQIRKKELRPVDHSEMSYVPIRKNLFVAPKELGALDEAEIDARRAEDEIKVRGKGCPPPIETFRQCGLPESVARYVEARLGVEATPFPVQKQAIPALMCGRDVIGVAKTGSGKTLAFLLPAVRHAADQPKVLDGSQGPIVLVMAPARELALQIFREAKAVFGAADMRAAKVYGGGLVAEQIADLKRGAEIIVATPGRLIDLLTMQQGRMLALTRVSFVVLDEADRMYDMGFEPQIAQVLKNARPDRQTALFSATFPKAVEALARKSLTVPLEIVCGGRSVASSSVEQFAELRDEPSKFFRTLQLLGYWTDLGSVLIFVDTQAKCDFLFAELVKNGYPCLALHGGHDQADRDSAIRDFSQNVASVMVATSVAGRGLDVPQIRCVINYSAPNHLEDYVHRVGRTGRAGRKGTAYTLIDPVDEEAYAPVVAKALSQAKQPVPSDLAALASTFRDKAKAGQAKWATSGFVGNRGYTFDELTDEQKIAQAEKKQFLQVSLGVGDERDDERRLLDDEEEEKGKDDQQQHLDQEEEGKDKDDDDDRAPSSGGGPAGAAAAQGGFKKDEEPQAPQAPEEGSSSLKEERQRQEAFAFSQQPRSGVLASALAAQPGKAPLNAAQQAINALSAAGKDLTPLERAKLLAAHFGRAQTTTTTSQADNDGTTPQARALANARALAASVGNGGVPTLGNGGPVPHPTNPNHFYDELDINDYPPEARLKSTSRDAILRISEDTGAAIISRGVFVPPGRQPPPGEKRLYLAIEAPAEMNVKAAKGELTRLLNEQTLAAAAGNTASRFRQAYGKYAIV